MPRFHNEENENDEQVHMQTLTKTILSIVYKNSLRQGNIVQRRWRLWKAGWNFVNMCSSFNVNIHSLMMAMKTSEKGLRSSAFPMPKVTPSSGGSLPKTITSATQKKQKQKTINWSRNRVFEFFERNENLVIKNIVIKKWLATCVGLF